MTVTFNGALLDLPPIAPFVPEPLGVRCHPAQHVVSGNYPTNLGVALAILGRIVREGDLREETDADVREFIAAVDDWKAALR
jgi:hypothetical protein